MADLTGVDKRLSLGYTVSKLTSQFRNQVLKGVAEELVLRGLGVESKDADR